MQTTIGVTSGGI